MIKVIKEQDGTWQVWTNADSFSEKNGRCLGSGSTKKDALLEAYRDLLNEQVDVLVELAHE